MDVAATVKIERGATLACSVELPGLRLKILKGPESGRRVALALPVVRIGTDPENDLVLKDPKVSRRHARLTPTPDGVRLEDLGSANGTWLAGARVKDALLAPGARITVGESELEVDAAAERRTSVVGAETRLEELVGASPPMKELYGVLRAVAPTHASVLVLGESGTGKELVARTLHKLSGRKGKLVAFDAGSADPEQIRSDLFGHLKGAFTGAGEARAGAFRAAHQGTLFLDEIGELPKELQTRLLRVLETRQVTPLGADEPVPVDVRVVAATNRNLAAEARAGRFRLDLYHRLAVVPVRTPPLRERLEDLPMLVAGMAESLGLAGRFSVRAFEAMAAHDWPGNVRELKNAVERAAALAGGGEIGPEHLRLELEGDPDGDAGDAAPRVIDKAAIDEALARCGGHRARAAKALGISPATLYRRLAELKDPS